MTTLSKNLEGPWPLWPPTGYAPWFVTKVIKHISDWSRNNQTNIVLCNASLHQLSKTTEIITGWESSIAVLTKIMNVQVLC